MLTKLVYNFNTNPNKEYTNVASGSELDDSLKDIEKFYYSDFWTSRFKKRLRDVGFRYYPLELDCILGTITELIENNLFKIFDESSENNGRSNKGTMIALNTNLSQMNDSHINNIIMHEFGHRLYNQPEFTIIKYLNALVIKSPIIKEDLTDKDYKYFTDYNEIRQRIIPIIKEMYDNNWSAEDAYELSENLKNDDIKDLFNKEYIIYLLENII